MICLAAAATLDALADGTLLDKHGEPLVFRRRRLQESYASRHKLEIVLGTLISFMVVKICEPCSVAVCDPYRKALDCGTAHACCGNSHIAAYLQ